MNRRIALKSIALGTSSLTALAAAQTAPAPVKIVALETLKKDGDLKQFKWNGVEALLVRVPAPDAKVMDKLLETKAVIQPVKGVFLRSYTLSCTHSGCQIDLPNKDGVMICPCHDSEFNAVDGSVKAGVARRPLQALRLEVRGADVFAVAVL